MAITPPPYPQGTGTRPNYHNQGAPISPNNLGGPAQQPLPAQGEPGYVAPAQTANPFLKFLTGTLPTIGMAGGTAGAASNIPGLGSVMDAAGGDGGTGVGGSGLLMGLLGSMLEKAIHPPQVGKGKKHAPLDEPKKKSLMSLPSYKKGGMVKKTGPAKVHKGEIVLSADKVKRMKQMLSGRG